MKVKIKGLTKAQLKRAKKLVKNNFKWCDNVHDCPHCPFYYFFDCLALSSDSANITISKKSIIIKHIENLNEK